MSTARPEVSWLSWRVWLRKALIISPKTEEEEMCGQKVDAKNIWKAVIKNYESVPEWEPVRLAQRECKAGICHRAETGRCIMNAWVLKNLPLGDGLVELITVCASAYEITILFLFFWIRGKKQHWKALYHLQSPSSPTWEGHYEPGWLLGGGMRAPSLASAMMS